MKYLLTFIFIIGGVTIIQSQVPKFKNGVFLMDGNTKIKAGVYSIPYFYDWDSDGKKDLMVAQFIPNKIRFYKNTGTDKKPVFNGFNFIQADNKDIQVGGY